MENTTVFPRTHEVDEAEREGIENAFQPCVILSREEKDYQRLVSEKLREAANWDVRDSNLFCLTTTVRRAKLPSASHAEVIQL